MASQFYFKFIGTELYGGIVALDDLGSFVHSCGYVWAITDCK